MKQSKSKKFYITTTLPYVNAAAHMGHALEFVQADIIARYHKLLGEDVFLNTGTDEHGLKIYRKAVEENKDPKEYVDEYAEKFKQFCKALDMDYTAFIRTTDPHHISAAQEFWRLCDKKGDIYKGAYKVKYCVGCELEKTDSELVDGRCPLHPSLEIEIIEEENYFFRFSNYQKQLLELYDKDPGFVVPDSRMHEIRNFVAAGLQDFSISRLKSKMPWGITVPGDDSQVMYVWFDALINYISTLGWPENIDKFGEFWGDGGDRNAIQIAGKDNLRQQSAMWQAMLMSAGLPGSKIILIHGFITGEGGLKMSKTLGNVVDPIGVINEFGTDALRYWFAREMPTFEDGAFTLDKFRESYNANLANGLGNLVSRVMKMAATHDVRLDMDMVKKNEAYRIEYNKHLEFFEIQKAANLVWDLIKKSDSLIEINEPFKKIKIEEEKENAKTTIKLLLANLYEIGYLLRPLMPETSAKITKAIEDNAEITKPLFPRL